MISYVLIQIHCDGDRSESGSNAQEMFYLKHEEMERIPKDRIEEAKRRLREELNIDEIRKIPKYRNFTEEQYVELLNNIERFAFLILESYISRNKGIL